MSDYFTPEFFRFLNDLAKNNDRAWFQKNKARYEEVVQSPAVRFIQDAGPHLRTISRYLVADPRPFGGSLMRIYRDVRFSKDKSPYRTTVGIHFPHEYGKKLGESTPGLYLHLESGESFAGSGVWQPSSAILKRIRDGIVEQPAGWRGVLRERPRLEGESLKRPPPGYDPNHPLIMDLMRKDFVAFVPFKDADVAGGGFMERFLDAGRAMEPLNRFLAEAMELPW
ncbi:MAG: DUF2461 domain-containing protein [Methanobacteriota archaeon]